MDNQELTTLQGKYKGKTLKDMESSDAQQLADFLISREIYCNMTTIVNNCMEVIEGFSSENITNLYGADEEECQEIFEWWTVTEWLHDKLSKLNNPVFTPNDFNYFWGRTCTGQSICLDYDIQKIAFDTFIN